jgi:hypothetical protein
MHWKETVAPSGAAIRIFLAEETLVGAKTRQKTSRRGKRVGVKRKRGKWTKGTHCKIRVKAGALR